MGLTSTATVYEGIKLCVFDLRRGQHEGEELEKILFFYPADCSLSTQLSVIGLSEGLITFTRIFSPEAACEVIEAQKHSHVFYQAEPDIWMVMLSGCEAIWSLTRRPTFSEYRPRLYERNVVEKNEAEAIWRNDALQKVLKEVHSLFVMFHGSVRALLERDPGGGLVRTHFYSFIMDFLTDFHVGKKLQLPSFRDCLKERGTIQMLTVGREAAISVQSLVRLVESLCAVNTTCNSLILFQDLLVSTTLSPDDTVNLFTYAVSRLTPNALSSATTLWSYWRKGSTATQVATGSFPANAGSSRDELNSSRDTSPSGHDQRYHVPRPLQHSKWSKGKDGFLVTDIWATEIGNSITATPTIWLQQTEERAYLCVYQQKNLTMILLIPVNSVVNGEQGISIVKQQIFENASVKILKVEEKLTRGWGGDNAYHVAGYRYLLSDSDTNISRASPPGKVTTLTKESLLALNKLREEVDMEKSRTKQNEPHRDKDLEICIRAKNNAWVIARITRGKDLYMVLEKANETLLYASDAIEKFSDRYCSGAFSLD